MITPHLYQIIMAKVSSMKAERYHRLIPSLESSDWFQNCRHRNWIRVTHLPFIGQSCTPRILGSFIGPRFRLSCRHFAVLYTPAPEMPVDKIWFRLQNITLRNKITYRLLSIMGKHQADFLDTGDSNFLIRLPYQKIIEDYSDRYPGDYMDASIISRIVRHQIILHNRQEVPVSDLLPKRSYLIGLKVMAFIRKYDPLPGDRELVHLLKQHFKIEITRRYVTTIRQQMGIPSLRERKKRIPAARPAVFSRYYPFTVESMPQLPADRGVYEISLTKTTHQYLLGSSPVVYLGSTNNIRARLLTYLRGFGHTEDIRTFMDSHILNICYHQTPDHRKLENKLIHGFIACMGELPLLNKIKPRLDGY